MLKFEYVDVQEDYVMVEAREEPAGISYDVMVMRKDGVIVGRLYPDDAPGIEIETAECVRILSEFPNMPKHVKRFDCIEQYMVMPRVYSWLNQTLGMGVHELEMMYA